MILLSLKPSDRLLIVRQEVKKITHVVMFIKNISILPEAFIKADNGFPGKAAYPLHYYHIKGPSPIDCWYGP